jgi:hypothetical protein
MIEGSRGAGHKAIDRSVMVQAADSGYSMGGCTPVQVEVADM